MIAEIPDIFYIFSDGKPWQNTELSLEMPEMIKGYYGQILTWDDETLEPLSKAADNSINSYQQAWSSDRLEDRTAYDQTGADRKNY